MRNIVALPILALALFASAQALADSVGPGGYSARQLFAVPRVRQVTINPAGDLLAAIVTDGEKQMVVLRGRDSSGLVIPKGTDRALYLQWVDDGHLLVHVDPDDEGEWRYEVVEIALEQGKLSTKVRRILHLGVMVDPLPMVKGQVLWAIYLTGSTRIFRLPLEVVYAGVGASVAQLRRGFAQAVGAERGGRLARGAAGCDGALD